MPGFSIPESFPLSRFEGQELSQVCIVLGQVQLNFVERSGSVTGPDQWKPGARIDIEAGFELRAGDGADGVVVRNSELARDGGQLGVLIGQQVESVDRLGRNEFCVRFGRGFELRLFTDETGYESYHLHVDGESVTVTKP